MRLILDMYIGHYLAQSKMLYKLTKMSSNAGLKKIIIIMALKIHIRVIYLPPSRPYKR